MTDKQPLDTPEQAIEQLKVFAGPLANNINEQLIKLPPTDPGEFYWKIKTYIKTAMDGIDGIMKAFYKLP